MQIVKAKATILNPFKETMSTKEYLTMQCKHIERIGRTCYKSESRITDDSYETFVKQLIKSKHTAMIEHGSFSVKFIVDRGVSHELVRHRIASFAQESTRYCNYGKKRGITFIKPLFFEESSPEYCAWKDSCAKAEATYLDMLQKGVSPQEARSVLPNSVKTEIVVTMNFRQWRHFFDLRALDKTGKAHPQMKEVTVPLLYELVGVCPIIFGDMIPDNVHKDIV